MLCIVTGRWWCNIRRLGGRYDSAAIRIKDWCLKSTEVVFMGVKWPYKSLPPYVLNSQESFTYVSPNVFSVLHKTLIFNILQEIVQVSFSAPNASQSCGAFFWFAQHERILTGASPQTALIVGRLQPKARVSAVRRNLKEAGGKRLAR